MAKRANAFPKQATPCQLAAGEVWVLNPSCHANKKGQRWRACDKAGAPFFLRTQPQVASQFEKQVIVLAFDVCYNNIRIRIQ
jgi:hypothetical protein